MSQSLPLEPSWVGLIVGLLVSAPGASGSWVPRDAVFVLPLSSSLGESGWAACHGSCTLVLVLAFFRAAAASLRRRSSGSFGQFGAAAACSEAGGGRSSLRGTTSGE